MFKPLSPGYFLKKQTNGTQYMNTYYNKQPLKNLLLLVIANLSIILIFNQHICHIMTNYLTLGYGLILMCFFDINVMNIISKIYK